MITCSLPGCGKSVLQQTGSINRAIRLGKPLYCSVTCAGVARRSNLTIEEKKKAKRLYDIGYRYDNAEKLKIEKAEYHKRTYDPAAAAIARRAKIPRHIEYCRRPQYKEKKAVYDRKRRASEYGDFAEAYLALLSVDREVHTRSARYDIGIQKGTVNKTQKRKRAAAATLC